MRMRTQEGGWDWRDRDRDGDRIVRVRSASDSLGFGIALGSDRSWNLETSSLGFANGIGIADQSRPRIRSDSGLRWDRVAVGNEFARIWDRDRRSR